ncbi:hypothetical protein AMEX_G27601 [Astyanax mexicanus]|uniref:Uncharacterized protein n=1 Tax=Astyanax mexicanus TaxID=7994 RepID=A0A8T2KSJ0_ASTMX|nr:hypothetical protein AMEX_G27601 [Astyanax mexicanus]
MPTALRFQALEGLFCSNSASHTRSGALMLTSDDGPRGAAGGVLALPPPSPPSVTRISRTQKRTISIVPSLDSTSQRPRQNGGRGCS